MRNSLSLLLILFSVVFFSACAGNSGRSDRSGTSNSAETAELTADSEDGSSEPWSADQLMPPAELADMLGSSTAASNDAPLIVCIGPGALIPGSKDVGQTTEAANLEKLQTLLSGEDRDRPVVLYCGCCPFSRCPNIRPAFSLLNEMKFTNHRLLNLATNLKTDWIDKGYPVVQ